MAVEVVVPTPPPVEFNFDSNCSSPFITAPSSPQRFGNFFSAPTSPGGIPRCKPGSQQMNDDEHEGFEFNFSGQSSEPVALSAEELFDGGKIRPFKPPSILQASDQGGQSPPASNASSPRSKISQGKRVFQKALLSPRHQKKESGPFADAVEETGKKKMAMNRGREKVSSSPVMSSSFGGSRRKGTRSLSPFRVSETLKVDPSRPDNSQKNRALPSATSNSKALYPASPSSPSTHSSFLSSFSFTKGYRKWGIKDFLLFRSASEGRADSKDPLRKFTLLSKKVVEEDTKNSSFRSTESSGSVSRRRGIVSPHELHYTVNRAVSEEMKKKTFLPYKQGVLGCLGRPGV